ncbi:MAG: tetratricopeptide repeat protein, partial [Desulfuromonadales bacterium]|nr:tetratricopeptide repeat protein [Desulfuromonadales bacterium]
MTLIMLLAVGDPGPSGEAAEPDLQQQIAEGGRLILDGDTEAAVELFQALIKKYPTDPEAYNNLAALYAQRGELEPARLTLEQALLTDTTYAT